MEKILIIGYYLRYPPANVRAIPKDNDFLFRTHYFFRAVPNDRYDVCDRTPQKLHSKYLRKC